MSVVLTVRDPRTGMVTNPASWAAWRRRWLRRPMSLAARVRGCPWCWCFGAREISRAGDVVEVPCLSCGRVGAP